MNTTNTYYKDKEQLKLFLEQNSLSDKKNLLVQVFTGIVDRRYIENLIDQIIFFLPNCHIIGSTTDGEILDANVTTTKTVLSFTSFEKISLKIDYVEYDETFNINSAYLLSKKIYQDNIKLIISFADGLSTNGEQFLKGISKPYSDVIVSGGLSADNSMFNETFVFTKNKIVSNGAVAVSLSGDLEVFTGYNFNWKSIGKTLTVTQAIDNIVSKIDGKNAFDTYKYYLGEEVTKRLPAIGIEFPLVVKRDGISLARAVTGVLKDGSLRFAGEIKVGEQVRFAYGNSEMILKSSTLIPQRLLDFAPESIFVYSCMARRRFMNHLIEKELDPLFQIDTISGFFTYGEFFTNSGNSAKLMNQTMTILAIKENSQTKTIDKKIINYKSKNEDLYTLSLKTLSHLINVTSNELETINDDLKESVEREKRIISQQQKRIEAQTKMAQLGNMMGHIAHQWRQPLSTISTAITSIQVQKELGLLKDEYFEKAADSIVKNVVYLSDTIKVFRDFLKEDKNTKTTTIQSIFKMAIDISSSMLKDYHIKIYDNIDYKKSYKVNLVSGEFIQVVTNILNNSKDAFLQNSIKDAFVKINCIKEKDSVLITIEDNAGGIDEKIIDKIFDLYFTTKKDEDGTGLGLHMCKDIVQQHMNGDIYVKNTQKGCCFFIKLPIIE